VSPDDEMKDCEGELSACHSFRPLSAFARSQEGIIQLNRSQPWRMMARALRGCLSLLVGLVSCAMRNWFRAGSRSVWQSAVEENE